MELTNVRDMKALLEANGFHFSKAKGQNFLIDAEIPAQIAESVCADSGSCVLEIGPGIGCLTAELAERAGKVISVELDRSLEPLLKETLAGHSNVEILFADVMKLDLKQTAEEKMPQETRLVCANLPYNITSPVLTKLIGSGLFERICVMIQKEVAERICAAPGSKSYGAFGLFVQWYCETELLFTVPPHAFMPQPKVTSAVIRLSRREKPPAETDDEELMFRIIRAAFNQRRKTLPNALAAAFPELGREKCAQALENRGIDTNVRGEVLDLHEFARISNELHRINCNNL